MSVGKKVGRPRLYRNKLNLSHERRMSPELFVLYPCLVDDVIPGDVWRIGNEMVVRMNPLFAPLMHEINVYIHYYFVPNRILWDQWEDFFTGGRDGNFVAQEPRIDMAMDTTIDSLWDYLGFSTRNSNPSQNILPTAYLRTPLAYPLRAYNLIYNEYYRDPNLTDPVDINVPYFGSGHYKNMFIRCWEKDYFTSMLPWQQRGDSPSMPIDLSNTPILWGNFDTFGNPSYPIGEGVIGVSSGSPPYGTMLGTESSLHTSVLSSWFNSARLGLADSASFTVNDMRLMFQIQKYLERNARVGPRYVEQLRGRYWSSPTDDRLQRPEYIGGSKTPVIISEVLQTSESGESPQGNMAGHGLSADHTYCGTYHCKEHGVIMGIMSVMPRAMYMDGIDRVWLKTDKFDYPHPEFVNLSEQAVMQSEIYNYPGAPDRIIGYQGRYDEYRWKRSTVHGLFRTETYMQWHMARSFANPPTLNLDLVRPNSDERVALKRALNDYTQPMFLVTLGNKCHVTRSLPYRAEPGLIDHN